MIDKTGRNPRKKKAVIAAFTGEGSRLAAFLCMIEMPKEKERQDENLSEWEFEAYVPERFFLNEWESLGVHVRQGSLAEWVKTIFEGADALIFIGAAGIAVRAVVPVLKDKLTDPAVLVIDEKATYVIPILSGHVGGGNALANTLAKRLNAQAIITTASDLNDCFAVDVFAANNQLVIWNRNGIKEITGQLLEGHSVGLITEGVTMSGELPRGIQKGRIERVDGSIDSKQIYITPFQRQEWMREAEAGKAIILIPKCLAVGVGCRKGADVSQIEAAVRETLEEHQIFLDAVHVIASIDRKKDEMGICQLAEMYGWEFQTFSAEELQKTKGSFSESAFVNQTVGVSNVCERAAVCASEGEIWIPKTIKHHVTTAAAWQTKTVYFSEKEG